MRFALIFAVICIFATVFFAQTANTRVSDLGWLAGCWESTNARRGLSISEMWMKPSGSAMMGVGRTLKDGKLIDYEFLRIVEDANGLSYISRPSANKEDTAFKLLRSSSDEIVFENPTHDFPQRIIYRKAGADKLAARIEGNRNGTLRGVDFAYTRAACN